MNICQETSIYPFKQQSLPVASASYHLHVQLEVSQNVKSLSSRKYNIWPVSGLRLVLTQDTSFRCDAKTLKIVEMGHCQSTLKSGGTDASLIFIYSA